jgi:hypothetical protein
MKYKQKFNPPEGSLIFFTGVIMKHIQIIALIIFSSSFIQSQEIGILYPAEAKISRVETSIS